MGGFLSQLDFENPKQCLRDSTTMPRSHFSDAGSILLKVHVYHFTLLGQVIVIILYTFLHMDAMAHAKWS